MHRRSFIKNCGAVSLVVWVENKGLTRTIPVPQTSTLEESFNAPPSAALPQVFWFWMNGHVTKQGITLDLEAMKRAGIGGVYNYDSGISIPQGPVKFYSSEWMELKQHAVKEANRLGLDYVMHNCPGWSSSGGPWITPELAMQQLTSSEMVVEGGKQIANWLPVPFHKLDYYRDVAVLAFPSQEGEIDLQNYTARTGTGSVDREAVTGENPAGVTVYPTSETEDAWLLFAFVKASEVRFLTFLISAVPAATPHALNVRSSVQLEASNDGVDFTTVATISTGLEAELAAGDKFITYDIQPTKAKFFRLRSSQARRYSQVRFSGIDRLKNFMEKTGNRFLFSGEETSPLYQDYPQQDSSVINSRQVVDLTNRVNSDGFLQWTAPPGKWTIMRFGFTPTGAINKAAPEDGSGLECDKFSKAAVEFHFQKTMEKLSPVLRQISASGKLGLSIDSYEAGPQTWTEKFPGEFQQRCGYSLLPYLPALTGRIVDSTNHTERFLWDVRKVQSALMTENYYGRFSSLCHEQGLRFSVEPYDKGPFEEMEAGAHADVCMGEAWYGLQSLLPGNFLVRRTSKLAASIQSIHGRSIVGAEAFTSEPESSRWQAYPFSLKALGDQLFTEGVNRLIIHCYVHQPHPTASPGMTMGPWGIQFNRTNTWFEKGRPWLQYLARCQALLQQGLPVRDLLYFTGEEANVYTRVDRNSLVPSPPAGYDYDVINAEAILRTVVIKDGEIVLPHGMQYRVLVLQNFKGITLPLLRKLAALVTEGMILVGARPKQSLGLISQTNDEAFRKTVEALWGSIDGSRVTENRVDKGLVIWGPLLTTILQRLHIKPDFVFSSLSNDAPLLYVHRRTPEADVYFIGNQRRTTEDVVCSFRVKNKMPEVWDAGKGTMIPSVVYEATEEEVRLPLQLEPYGSLFLVFRKAASAQRIVTVKNQNTTFLQTDHFVQPKRTIFPGIKNNFSISLWAKPEMNIMAKQSVHMGNVEHPYTDFYAVYPSPGANLYGAGHAVCGLAIGRNGVAVWENETYPVQVLVAETPIAGWSYIALVYDDATPAVYVNGQLAAKGKKSTAVVHPGLGEVYGEEGASFYNGDSTLPKLSEQVLSQEQIKQQAKESPHFPLSLPSCEVRPLRDKTTLLAWENGAYHLLEHSGKTHRLTVKEILSPLPLNNWQVHFPPNAGAPPVIQLPQLISLHRMDNPGVKYFSGTAVYKTSFSLFDKPSATKRWFLDLGRVEVLARVVVNGKDCGTVWRRPYRTEITHAVRTGMNVLQIEVTNLWPNRLIGDEQAPDPYHFSTAGTNGFEQLAGAGFENQIGRPIEKLPQWYLNGEPKPNDGRVAFTTWKHYTKNDPLLESGLIGPVMLLSAVVKVIGDS